MRGYKDKTFCTAPCINTECHRNLNDKVRADAAAWWGDREGPAPMWSLDMSEGCEIRIKPPLTDWG